jgi:hypothetical protein
MRYFLLPLFVLIHLVQIAAQNLVPNPSFEDTIECPTSVTEIFKAQNWLSFRESPDYYHGCNNNINGIVGVPSNWICYQDAHTGMAYAGIITYELTGAPPPQREYLAVRLIEATKAGHTYSLTFYINFAGGVGFTIAANNLGVVLTNGYYSTSNPYPITNNPIAYNDSIYTDTLGWSKVSLSFVSDSAYQYLVFGNFFDDQNTDTINWGQFNSHSYYLIDDVCLSVGQVGCDITSVPEETTMISELVIFPVPASDALHVQFAQHTQGLRVIDMYGREVFSSKDSSSGELLIDCSSWSSGCYILIQNSIQKKIFIQH